LDAAALEGAWTVFAWLLQPYAAIAGTSRLNTTLVLFFMDEFFPMEKGYIIETMTMRLIPIKSDPTTTPTAMFWLSSCFSISSRRVTNSNSLKPASMRKIPTKPKAAVPKSA
jgi:hypothetical protein